MNETAVSSKMREFCLVSLSMRHMNITSRMLMTHEMYTEAYKLLSARKDFVSMTFEPVLINVDNLVKVIFSNSVDLSDMVDLDAWIGTV